MSDSMPQYPAPEVKGGIVPYLQVDGVFKAIAEAASAGEEISLPGFGKFKVKATPAREGRNPSTGATIKIAAAKKLTFAPAKALKDSLNS